MAGNSSTFYLRRQMNDANLKQWQSWSIDINYVVDQFNDVIQNLTDKLDLANTTINALTLKVNKLAERVEYDDLRYVKLQHNSISINSTKNTIYTKACGVFSFDMNKPHKVYIISTKTINGLYINNIPVYENRIGSYNNSFTSISGSDEGNIISITSDNMTKIGGNIELYFSLNPSLNDNAIGSYFNENNNTTARLIIKPDYSQIVIKPIVTVDKSALSKTLTNQTAMSTNAMTVSKYGAQIGQYSTVKTAAAIAQQKINKLK